MVKVTKQAIEKFNEMKQRVKDPENAILRVVFAGYGWGGPKLQLTLDELKNSDDVITKSEGINVAYSPELEAYINGSTIDYSNSWFTRGFTIYGGNFSSC